MDQPYSDGKEILGNQIPKLTFGSDWVDLAPGAGDLTDVQSSRPNEDVHSKASALHS